jgi:hypothetical protein
LNSSPPSGGKVFSYIFTKYKIRRCKNVIYPIQNIETNSIIQLQQHMKKYVHTLCLKNNKWFLYVSGSTADNWNFIRKESAILFEFVRENRPIMVFDSTRYVDVFELNALVKRYMKYYGIENVRGGSYTDSVLPDHVIASIDEELFQDTGILDENIVMMEEIYRTYEDRYTTPDEIRAETQRVEQDLQKYYAIQEKCRLITINRNVFDDFDWIKRRIIDVKHYCSTNTDFKPPVLDTIEVRKYNQIIQTLQAITRQFHTIVKDNSLLFEDSPYLLTQPDVQLETLFFHSHLIHDSEIYFSRIEKMMNYFEYMTWVLINRSEEFHFDLGQYELHFEKRAKLALQYLQNEECSRPRK